MRIKRLDIIGFKSFPDKSTLIFDQPIIGIVGPNGCGKSNIVDAIRWVIGEQRLKILRGETREDIIFTGSETRGPIGMAEVTITFDNSDRLAPSQYADFTEISVTRKIYRDGDSEFLINKTPCRLRDITDLFLGTGAGTRAYSIVEQGRISLIVSAKPEDRRLMIEEAAGITKYHSRKREAENKMAYTRQNLLRIRDIIAELKKRFNSLSRQAKKAERYREFKKRLKELDLFFASSDYADLLRKADESTETGKSMHDEVEESNAKLIALENEIEARGLKLAEGEDRLKDRQRTLYQFDQAIGLTEQNIEFNRKKIAGIAEREEEIARELGELEGVLVSQRARVKKLESEMETALDTFKESEIIKISAEEAHREALISFSRRQSEVDSLKDELGLAIADADRAGNSLDTLRYRQGDNERRTEENRAERINLQKSFDGKKSERDGFTEALGGLRQMKLKLDHHRTEQSESLDGERNSYVSLEEKLADTGLKLAGARSRLDSLRELDHSLEGFEQAVKTALANEDGRFGEGELIDVLARLIEVDPDYEKAVGAVLGERLQWLVVRDRESARKGLDLLREVEAGRAGFVAGCDREWPRSEPPGDAEALLDYVSASGAAGSVIKGLLSGVFVVDDLDRAVGLWTESDGSMTFVTKEGDLVHKSGAFVGGGGETLPQSLLRRQREMQELDVEVESLEKRMDSLSKEREGRLSNIRMLEGEFEEIREKEKKQEIRILEQEKDLHHLEAELDRLRGGLESLDREFIGQQEELRGLLDERRDLEARRDECLELRGGLENRLKEGQERLGELSDKREKLSREATEARVAAASAAERRLRVEAELEAAGERESDMLGRSESLGGERERGGKQIGKLEEGIAKAKAELENRIAERESLEERQSEKREQIERERAGIRELAAEVKTRRGEFEEKRDELNKAEMRHSELLINTRHLEERILEKYGVTLSTDYREHISDEEPGDAEREEMEKLKLRIERMGEVNLAAIKEHDEVSERYQFMCDQEDDLTRSLEKLETAIRKINRTTRKRLKETFEKVNENFSKLFPQLFGGGEARLTLTDSQDILTTGVDIVARPPGSALQSVNLLSGGQKALTAISLIFAIFLYRPTPFCLLDEVDAPLDDVNIGRFEAMLKRISRTSQFILITHNKRTMEITNTLYGVTMEEPGISKLVSVNLT